MLQQTVEGQQNRLRAGATELQKGNLEIQRLAQESRELKEKLKNKSEVIRRQVCVEYLAFFVLLAGKKC